MKRKSFKLIKPGKRTLVYSLLISSACLLAQAPSASAGKEGVFLAADTYFTLEHVSFSSGVGSSTVQFVLNLHNGDTGFVDFNLYGVRLVDDQGNRYPAKLTSKQAARVAAGDDRQFRFYSEVPAGITPDQLKVDLYTWDVNHPANSAGLGALSVSAAAASAPEAAGQLLVSLYDINSSYPQEAFVSIRLGNSYEAAENGNSYLYTDLYVQNGGTSSIQLPSNLQLRLKGPDSATYTGAWAGGSTETLLPNKMTKLTLRTAVPDSYDPEPFILEVVYPDSSGERILGSFPVSGTFALSPIGQEQPYSLYGTDNGLTVRTDKAVAVKQAEGYLVQTTVTIRNSGAKVTSLPSLSASYLFGTESIGATGQDLSVRTGFLSPGQSASYRFAVLLPEGIDPAGARFALFEQAASAAGSSSNSGSTSNNSSSGSSQNQSSSSSNTNTNSRNSTDSNTSSDSDPSSGGSSNGNTNANSSGSSSSQATGSSSNANASSSSNGSSSGNSNGSSGSTNGTTGGSGSNRSGSSDKSPVMLVSLSNIEQADNMTLQALPYQPGSPLPFSANGLIDKQLEISLVELHMHENSDFGYKTAVAKYKLTNRGITTLAMPNLGTELLNKQGLAFAGERQSGVADKIAPNTSYVVSYSYLLPASEDGSQLALNFTDSKSTSTGKLSIGTYRVAVQPESADNLVSFYPFDVSFDDYRINTTYSSGNYTYRLDLTLTVDMKEPVILDQNFSQMEFELVDSLDRVLGSQTMSFTGTSKLISGLQKISFANIKTEQFENNLVINVYETINTPSGPAKRLVKQLKP